MYFINKNLFLRGAVSIFLLSFLFLTSCTSGVQSGEISASFSGINTVTAISPTAVKITWTNSENFKFYDIYVDFQKDALLADQIFGEATVEKLNPGTNYKFKVLGRGTTTGAGNDRQLEVKTWDRFSGVSAVTKDGDGNIEVSWDYANNAQEYYIFYREEEAPTAENTDGWKTPNITTFNKNYLFKDLKGSTTYFFVVQALYRNGEVERNTNFLSDSTKSSFGGLASWVQVPRITIGALPSFNINIPDNPLFPLNRFTTSIYKDGNPISDPLIGKGKITFSSGIKWDLGKISGISTRIQYKDSSKKIDETFTIPNQSTYIKGLLDKIDNPVLSGSGIGQAFLGKAVAVGDFNCDGYDDVAIGMPESVIGAGANGSGNQGAVYVYYGGQRIGNRYYLRTSASQPQTRSGIITPDPQIITFPDLKADTFLGRSLAVGNLNGDRNGSTYQCMDLAIGAPGAINRDGVRSGSVFLIYGSTTGLKFPSVASAIAENTSTCNGLADGASCTPVRLWADSTLWPRGAFSGNVFSGRVLNHASFGNAIAFIGDFNADGYSELAIGAPNAPWDGDLATLNLSAGFNYEGVGFVALFFGSQFGLSTVTPTTTGTDSFRFLKIYPPLAQPGMNFGSSIAGGADVDGKDRREFPSGSGKYVGGSDFVVGAPNYSYKHLINFATFPAQGSNPNSYISILPFEGGWWGSDSTNFSNPYGFDSIAGVGTSFLYFGRNNLSIDDASFWSCGSRGSSASTHFSCLASPTSYRVLFPRDSETRAFGSAVAMLGDESSRDSTNYSLCVTFPTTTRSLCRDPNGDGYADIFVAGSDSGSTSKPLTGAVWQFFGNSFQIYERGASSSGNQDQFINGTFYNTIPQCVAFDQNINTVKSACAPVRIRPNSIPSSTRLGAIAGSMVGGDINRDGLLDLVIGGIGYNPDGQQPQAGGVFMFPSARSVGINTSYSLFAKAPVNASVAGYDQLGYSVGVGDFDAIGANTNALAYSPQAPKSVTQIDLSSLGYQDIIGGAPYDEVQRPAGGAVHFFLSGGDVNSPTILPSNLMTNKNINANPVESLVDKLATSQSVGYGYTRLVGDINGDGFDDAVSQIQGFDNTGTSSNTGIIFFGSPLGLITTTFCLNNQSRIFTDGKSAGNEVNCIPSYSHTAGITISNIVLPQLMRKPNNVSPSWAYQSFPAGDVNGDGFRDVVFIDQNSINSNIILYYGSRSGLQDIVVPSNNPNNSDPQIVSKKLNLRTNYSTQSFYSVERDYRVQSEIVYGDFNADGFSDIVFADAYATGPKLTSPTLTEDGQIISILQPQGGGATSPNGTWICPSTLFRDSKCVGEGPDYHGVAYVFYGSASGLQTPLRNNNTDIDIASNVMSIYDSIADSSKRSCNDSGICKVTKIRNPVFFNSYNGFYSLRHYFGSSMTVMNYNGNASGVQLGDESKNYDDLLVTSPEYQNPECTRLGGSASEKSQGRIFLYAGSKWGLVGANFNDYWPSKPGEIDQCPISNLGNEETGLGFSIDPTVQIRALRMPFANPNLNYNANGGRGFAARITSAGDLNGDGQEDLAVSAPSETVNVDGAMVTNGGAVYIYYGPLCPTDNDFSLLNKIQNDQYGTDFYSINKQKTFLDLGVQKEGSCGSKLLAPQKIVIKDASPNNRNYGFTLTGGRFKSEKNTGDINGEITFPISDLIVGTKYFNNTTTNTTMNGRGVILFGSAPDGTYPGGLFADDYPSYVVETISGTKIKPYILQMPSISNSEFFYGNISTGDINNDGGMDLMIPSIEYDMPATSNSSGGINMGTFLLFY